VKKSIGNALYQAQKGFKALTAKPLHGFGGAGVLEVVEDYQTDSYRAVYTLKFADSGLRATCVPEEIKEGTSYTKAGYRPHQEKTQGCRGTLQIVQQEDMTMRPRAKATKTKKRRARREKIEIGSGNVFADLGFEDSEQLLLKAELATRIAQLLEKRGWTQTQTAERTGLDQPKVSRLLRGQLSGFSADRLFAILNRLGHSVEVRISPKERAPEKSHTRVMIG